ncbi:MAG: 50S ribosomal protein L21 [Thermotoga sp.]|nr:50S ribosomal protein L21 [Thermotogota bacterium]RKX53678.1 MAG: 50S ribosomal protein L21 [Thermotoga sp.]
MYAIIETSGKQYKVEEGNIITTQKQAETSEGKQIVFDKILLLNAKDDIKLGTPYVDGVKVYGTILTHKKGEKKVIIKFKGRKKYRRKLGHRQWYTDIRIDKIEYDIHKDVS